MFLSFTDGNEFCPRLLRALVQEDAPPPGPETTPENRRSGKLKKRPAAAVEKSATLESETEPAVKKKPSKKEAAKPSEPAAADPLDEDATAAMKKPSAKAKNKPKAEKGAKSRKSAGDEVTFHNPSWHKGCNNWCLKSSHGHIMSVP